MTDNPAVRVRGLRKAYGKLTALDGIDLDVAQGEVLALLGPNGAGKTTTVEILAGHRDRDAGEVAVLGRDPGRADLAWRAELGIVLQGSADLGELTVRESVHHFARYFPRPRDPDEVIALVGLTGKAGARIRTLSGGQRRRLDVAVGVVGRPRLLFLDEPTTGFDPQARRLFWDLVRSLAGRYGTTILLTTHYLDEAEALADRLVVIAGGRVVAEGAPATLGGRAAVRACVRWADGQQDTDDPAALVADLTRRYAGTVPGLTVTRPSLEDVYLDLIGEHR
ncbi:ABC transporter ATP-binding protein [Micromonospora endolithica]|uniref:ABC transporter ATP-binding protein n=1 Tax=Micromonospora endolithica TaxID=230091 RepID=A0A3A9ZQP9_9ACTN|nr:ABC transporter ATP-binding protein [Micromonospora endolithica]RKN50515.1 ABC transporter ATP-binding protein [Micromonospora endolithica]TWJ20785.1 ABC-2 type transport system ATP-binding protein [Micromonospora endolithica]